MNVVGEGLDSDKVVIAKKTTPVAVEFNEEGVRTTVLMEQTAPPAIERKVHSEAESATQPSEVLMQATGPAAIHTKISVQGTDTSTVPTTTEEMPTTAPSLISQLMSMLSTKKPTGGEGAGANSTTVRPKSVGEVVPFRLKPTSPPERGGSSEEGAEREESETAEATTARVETKVTLETPHTTAASVQSSEAAVSAGVASADSSHSERGLLAPTTPSTEHETTANGEWRARMDTVF